MNRIDEGVLSLEYHLGRKTKNSWKYRLLRRTEEVLGAIRTYKGDKLDAILDVGTADAMMLDLLTQNLDIKKAVGLDSSIELLGANTNPKLDLVHGDATKLPFGDNLFDVVIATAVIEHVSEPEKIATECYRVLRQNGIVILTTPDPFFEWVATKIGHLKEEQHQKTFKLSELISLFESQDFETLKAEKFMMSPIGFPYEIEIEKFMKSVGLGFLLFNQLLVAQKIS